MMLEKLFSLAGAVVLPVWLLLMFVPGWRWTQRLATFAVPLLLACLYVWLLGQGKPPDGASFSTLAGVGKLFEAPAALLAGWVHYLVFDLFTGAWEARDARALGISRWAVAPCLVLTFLLGPVGLGFYLLLRLAMRRKVGAAA